MTDEVPPGQRADPPRPDRAPDTEPPPPPPPEQPSAVDSRSPQEIWRTRTTQLRWVYTGGVAAAVLGLLMPWAKGPFGMSVSGLETTDGKIVALMAAGAGAIAWRHITSSFADRWWIGLVLLGLAIGGVALWDALTIESDIAVAGTGIWLDVAGGAALASGAVMERGARRHKDA